MSSGMNMQEAKKIAERMSYRQAVLNCLNARCVPFRKATKIKMKQLLESIDNDFTDDLLNMGYTKGYQNGRADAFDEAIKSIDDEYFDGGYGDYHEVAMIVRMLKQLKEQKK